MPGATLWAGRLVRPLTQADIGAALTGLSSSAEALGPAMVAPALAAATLMTSGVELAALPQVAPAHKGTALAANSAGVGESPPG